MLWDDLDKSPLVCRQGGLVTLLFFFFIINEILG